jgi:hypothetical protein
MDKNRPKNTLCTGMAAAAAAAAAEFVEITRISALRTGFLLSFLLIRDV